MAASDPICYEIELSSKRSVIQALYLFSEDSVNDANHSIQLDLSTKTCRVFLILPENTSNRPRIRETRCLEQYVIKCSLAFHQIFNSGRAGILNAATKAAIR